MKFIKASLCLSVALALTACSEKVSLETHISNAKNYLSQDKVNESIIELKNAISMDTQNGEARFLLGQLYLNLGDGLAAVKELERAQTLNYANNKVLPLLARAYLLTDSDTDVLALNSASEALSAEEKSRYLAYRTLAALRSEQPEVAMKSVELAESIAPQSLYSLLASAYFELSENNHQAVKTQLSRVLAFDEKQVDALMLQGQVSMATEDYEQAALSFKAYLNLQPRSGIVQLLLADALLKSGQDAEAEKYADKILAQVERQPYAHYIKGMVAFNAKDYEKAIEHSEIALSSDFNQINLSLVAGVSAFYLQEWQKSYRHLSDIVKYLPVDHQVRRMLAITQVELGLVDEIGETLGDFESSESGDAEFISSLSYKLLALGATEQAKKLLAQNESSAAGNAKDNARQGILKLMMNDPSGMQNLQDALDVDPELVEAELALAYAALQSGDVNKAREIALKWQQQYPDKAGGFNLMASIEIKEENYVAAEKTLQQSLAIESDNLFALTEQLRLARQQKNEVLSKERADYLIKLAPDNNKVLKHYFGVYRNEMALAQLESAYTKDKTDIDKAIIVAEAMLSLSQYKQADILLAELADTPQLPKRYWQVRILSYKQQNDKENTLLTLDNWLKASPYHLEPVIMLADFYSSEGKNDRALNVVERGLTYHKEHLLLQLVKMQLLLNNQQLVAAKSLYAKLVNIEINDALKQGMQGRIYLLEKEFEQAIPKLTTFYNANPSNQSAMYLASAYLGDKDKVNAARVLENFLSIEPDDDRIKTILAGIYLEKNTEKSIAIYEDTVTKQPKNIIAHNNLAWLYLEKNELTKALNHAEKAVELAPEIANVIDTYSQVLLKTDDKRAALKYASKAMELTKGENVDILLNYAEVLIANNRSNEAADILNKIITTTDTQKEKKAKLASQL